MDDAVVVGIDSLEGEPGLVAIEAAVQQLLQGREGEVAVIHGLVVDPDLPTHEGLALRGKGRGIGQDVLLIGIGGDHVASTDDVLVLVHELEVDDTVVVGKDGLEGQPGLILVEVLAVLLHECIERIVGELALIHGGIPKTHLPAHKGLALGGEAGGSRGLKLDAGGGGDDIAAAQGHVLAVHIVHKGHMDGVVHSALTVQADHEGIRDNPLDVVVIQHNGHGGAVHTGVSLRIGVIRRHIGGGIELDVVVITLDAQTVARHRVAAIQQAGGDGLVALGGAVHLQVPQKGLQLGIRGGDSADGDRDNIVINHQVALFRQLITLGDPAGINVGGLHAVGVGSHSHGVAVAHLLTGHLVLEADRDVSRDALKDRGDGNAALGTIPVDMRKHIAQSRVRRQPAAVLTVVGPAGEFVAGRGGDALKVIDNGIRLSEGFLIEHLTGGLGQISLGGIRNVVVDGDGAVLLDKYSDCLCSGFDNERVGIRVGQNIALGKRQSAQRKRHVLGGGDRHARGAALHIFHGVLVHKFDGNLTGFSDNLGDKRDVVHSELVGVRFKTLIVERPAIELSIADLNLPAHKLHPIGNVRSRRSNCLSGIGGGNCEVSGINLSYSVALMEGQIKGMHLGLGPGTGDHNISVVDLALARISPAAESIGVALAVLHLAASAIRGIHRIRIAGLQAVLSGGERHAARRNVTAPGVGDIVALRVVRCVISIAIYRPHGIEGGRPGHSDLVTGLDEIGRRRAIDSDVLKFIRSPAQEQGILLRQTVPRRYSVLDAFLDLGAPRNRAGATVGVVRHGVLDHRLLVGQGHSDGVGFPFQSIGRFGKVAGHIRNPDVVYNLFADIGNLADVKARVAGQPQPLGLGGSYLVSTRTSVLHRQGSGADGVLGLRELNGASVLAVRSPVVQGSFAIQGDSRGARRLGSVLDLDLIGQGDGSLQTVRIGPVDGIAVHGGGDILAVLDPESPVHQIHFFAQRVADQADNVLADLLEAQLQIIGIIGVKVVILARIITVAGDTVELLAGEGKTDGVDFAAVLLKLTEVCRIATPVSIRGITIIGSAVSDDDHHAVGIGIGELCKGFLHTSRQVGSANGPNIF